MKKEDHVIAHAVRIEYVEQNGKVFIVFEVTDEKSKKDILKTWVKDLEYRIINKNLVTDE